MQTKLDLTLISDFAASPEAVYHAWTSGADTIRWVDCPGADILKDLPDAVIGGTWHTEMRDRASGALFELNGVYREVVPNRKLVFTQGSNDAHRDDICTVIFEGRDGGTRMTFTQEPFAEEVDRASYVAGWTASFDKLAKLLAGSLV